MLAGADLNAAGKKRLKAFNSQIATLQSQFNLNVQKEANASALVVGTRAELDELYGFLSQGDTDPKTIVYCRIGERSSHTWFVLNYLLGLPGVRNYDGSWTEWGSLVGVPIVKGTEPGLAPVL